MPENIERPDVVETEHLEYLDDLRESGVTNMFGASSYLVEEFNLNTSEAKAVLTYWMTTFRE